MTFSPHRCAQAYAYFPYGLKKTMRHSYRNELALSPSSSEALHIKLPVPYQDLIVSAEIPRQPFGEINRAMTSAGATDPHSQVIPIVADEAG
jgi:hypothetical protein